MMIEDTRNETHTLSTTGTQYGAEITARHARVQYGKKITQNNTNHTRRSGQPKIDALRLESSAMRLSFID